MEITSLTISQTTQLINAGQISPLELIQAYISRIEKINPAIHALITFSPEKALEQAKSLERRGKTSLPLKGIPMAFKDLFDTKGLRTTMGSRFFSENIPGEDARAVELLLQAGVICLGKTNMHEIALGITNVNPHFGVCRNPWNREHITGGSSGGSAAALAAGLCQGALGSDTGGSIRIPASLCGVVGLKPTYGRVSLKGVFPLSWTSDHAGPMARCVEDIAFLLPYMAGYDASDPASIDLPLDKYSVNLKNGIKDWRVALASDAYFSRVDAEVLSAVKAAALVFNQLGAKVEEVAFPGAQEAAAANGLIVTSEAACIHDERIKSHPDWFGADVLQRLQKGATCTAQEYMQARRTQVITRRQFEQFFGKYDVLLSPTTPSTAPLIVEVDAVGQAPVLTRFTAPFNLTGFPAISLPCGFTHEGMPIGLQIVGQPWAEAVLLRAAYAYQQSTSWHLKQPVII
jgi:aspartyl-tRNA(Asn)/glutamyl-tRNA(Gln) amidotransferase subunit A